MKNFLQYFRLFCQALRDVLLSPVFWLNAGIVLLVPVSFHVSGKLPFTGVESDSNFVWIAVFVLTLIAVVGPFLGFVAYPWTILFKDPTPRDWGIRGSGWLLPTGLVSMVTSLFSLGILLGEPSVGTLVRVVGGGIVAIALLVWLATRSTRSLKTNAQPIH